MLFELKEAVKVAKRLNKKGLNAYVVAWSGGYIVRVDLVEYSGYNPGLETIAHYNEVARIAKKYHVYEAGCYTSANIEKSYN